MSDLHRIAMSLPPEVGLESVEMIASAGSWPLVEDNSSDTSRRHITRRTWAASPNLWLTCSYDLATGACAFHIFGEEMSEVSALVDRVTPLLQPLSREESFSVARASANRKERARALVSIALTTHDEFDPPIYQLIKDASQDADPAIRMTAAWSITYLSWPAALTVLEAISQEDPHDQVRNSAENLLRDFKRPGE